MAYSKGVKIDCTKQKITRVPLTGEDKKRRDTERAKAKKRKPPDKDSVIERLEARIAALEKRKG